MNYFGIDLGTTNSCIASYNGVTYEVIKLKNGNTTLPSCVLYAGGDTFIVGSEAYNQRAMFVNDEGISNVAYSVKRLMGKDEIVKLATPSGECKEFTPTFLSSLILKELVKQASEYYDDIHKVVITVPAYFTQNAIRDTVKAGEMAGLEVLSILQEPTAAVLAYSHLKNENINTKCLVYDLGGGTFDVSLVDIAKTVSVNEEDKKYLDFFSELYSLPRDKEEGVTDINVLSIEGNSSLGGDDIDNDTLKILLEKIRDLGFDIKKFTTAELESFKIQLERCKKDLSEYSIPVTTIGNKKVKHVSYAVMGLRDFGNGVDNTYRKTKEKIHKVMSKIDISEMRRIILVGGSTKSPFIRKRLIEDFPNCELDYVLNPDESVAIGASVKSYILQSSDSNIKIKDVLPISIGIEMNDKVRYVIPKDATFPTRKTVPVSTVYDDQDYIEVKIYEGESRFPEECNLLGVLEIENIPKKKKGEVPIGITVQITSTGRLKLFVNIDSNIYEKEITNLLNTKKEEEIEEDFALSEKELKVFNKKISRWTRYSKNLNGTKKSVFDDLLDRFKKHEDVEKEIVKFIKDNPLDREEYVMRAFDIVCEDGEDEDKQSKKKDSTMKVFRK